MKRTLSFILSVIMVFGILTSVPLTVNAASVDDLTFELNHNGKSYTVTGCYTYAEGELVIPDRYEGLPVTSIGDSAFYGCSGLTSITIPDSIELIAWYAFQDCTNLAQIIIGVGVNNIGIGVFLNCSKLTSISVKSNNGYYSSYDGVLYNKDKTVLIQYPVGKTNTTYTVSDGVTIIEQDAFRGCTNLTSVTIPNNVTSIEMFAFAFCSNLKSVVISNNVSNVGVFAFMDCKNLLSIAIPKSVTNIGVNAFGYLYTPEYEVVKNDEFIIYGAKGSAAEVYANENGFTFIEGTGECLHTYTKWVTDKKATVNAAGKKHKECTECGEILETATIKQLKCSKPKLSKIENTSSGVKITWGKVSGADKYYVYRKTGSSGKYSKIATTSKTYFTDKKASSGKKYYYYVKAVNEAGSSSSSNSLSKYYLADTTLKTPSSTKKGIVLKWSKIAGGAGYMVYRKTGSGSYSKIATVKGSTKVTYTDKKAKKGKTYTYKVKAYKSKTYSAYSNAKKIKDKY